MRVEPYSDIYFLDVFKLIEKFHKEYLTEYYSETKSNAIIETIQSFNGENSKNAFLLIIEDSCVGLIAGIEIKSPLNEDRFFQEIIFYVEKPFGKHGIYLIKQTEIMLKSQGFSNMIMAVLENSRSHKIKRIYERLGFKPLETHYVRVL